MDATNRIERDEPTEAVFLTLSEVEAIIIGIPEMLAGVEFRLKFFSDKDKAVPLLMEGRGITEDEALQECEDNLALCHSLLETYPGILEEMKEVYPMLQRSTEERDNKVIINPKDGNVPTKGIRLSK